MGLPIGMTLYFLDCAKTSAERPYPRVVRVEGEPGRAESMTLARAEKRLEHDLAAALQASEPAYTGRTLQRRGKYHRCGQQRAGHQPSLRSARPGRRQVLPDSPRGHHAG